jgi:hypothetical protein
MEMGGRSRITFPCCSGALRGSDWSRRALAAGVVASDR